MSNFVVGRIENGDTDPAWKNKSGFLYDIVIDCNLFGEKVRIGSFIFSDLYSSGSQVSQIRMFQITVRTGFSEPYSVVSCMFDFTVFKTDIIRKVEMDCGIDRGSGLSRIITGLRHDIP